MLCFVSLGGGVVAVGMGRVNVGSMALGKSAELEVDSADMDV
jgi:hypothetical protein